MRRAAPPLLPLILALVAATAAASGLVPPEGAATSSSDALTVAHWLGSDQAVDADGLAAAETGTLWIAVKEGVGPASNETTGRFARVNLTSSRMAFANASLLVPFPQERMSVEWFAAATNVTLAADAAGNASYSYTVEFFEETANGTTLLASLAGQGAVPVVAPVPPPPPGGIPTTWLVVGGGVVVVGAGAALLAMRRRRERELMNAAPRRSQVMRELELERQLEKVEEKEPERAAEIKQEIRAQEQVREKRRELQILEAKRADALKTLDLLRKRHEAGGLTKLQYDNMVAKKSQDLQRIEAEIAEMEAQEPPGGAAA